VALKIAIDIIGPVARKQYLPYLSKVDDVVLGHCDRTEQTAREAAIKFSGDVFLSLDALALWDPDSGLVLT
jgi:predicted dehydrogenase